MPPAATTETLTEAPERGLQELFARVDAIYVKLQAIEARVNGDQLRLLTARQLADRWNVSGATDKRRLINLYRLCERRGLRSQPGQIGWDKTFSFAAVIAAESR